MVLCVLWNNLLSQNWKDFLDFLWILCTKLFIILRCILRFLRSVWEYVVYSTRRIEVRRMWEDTTLKKSNERWKNMSIFQSPLIFAESTFWSTFYIVSYCIKWVSYTSWTHSTVCPRSSDPFYTVGDYIQYFLDI